VKSPVESTLPILAVHDTAGFHVLLTVDLNCWDAPDASVVELGDTATMLTPQSC
jgi:hypothetical protein